MPETNKHEDIPFRWKSGLYKIDKEKLKKNYFKNFFGDIKNTIDEFVGENPKNITTIYVDLDLYTSTKNFLQINKLKNYLSPRVFVILMIYSIPIIIYLNLMVSSKQ